jgi:hypothetical protein
MKEKKNLFYPHATYTHTPFIFTNTASTREGTYYYALSHIYD